MKHTRVFSSLCWLFLVFVGNFPHKVQSFKPKPTSRKLFQFTREKEGKWRGPFYFIQGTDTQFGLKDRWNNVSREKENWRDEMESAQKAIAAINNLRPRPKFFIFCGDQVDDFPWEKYYKSQHEDLQPIIQKLDDEIPMLCVCGNHDIGNRPSVATIANYRTKNGDDYYSFWVGGVFFIVLNSQYFYDSSLVPHLKKQQDAWLDEQLKIAKSAKHAVVFQHIPWFLHSADEGKEGEQGIWQITKKTRNEVLEKLHKAGVKLVFSGHYHRNAGGFDGDLEMVVTTAIGYQFGKDKPGMRIVKVTSDKISHSFEQLGNFPTNVDLKS